MTSSPSPSAKIHKESDFSCNFEKGNANCMSTQSTLPVYSQHASVVTRAGTNVKSVTSVQTPSDRLPHNLNHGWQVPFTFTAHRRIAEAALCFIWHHAIRNRGRGGIDPHSFNPSGQLHVRTALHQATQLLVPS